MAKFFHMMHMYVPKQKYNLPNQLQATNSEVLRFIAENQMREIPGRIIPEMICCHGAYVLEIRM